MSDNTVVNEAKKWIDELSDGTGTHGSWRLETIGKKYRYQKGTDGKRHRVPVRIRRFVKGIPWSLVFEALKYLESQAPYSGFLFNGVKVDAKYRPTTTVWRRDDQEAVGGNAQGSYTLIQDLIEDGFDDELDTATSSSCAEDVVTQWHWDSAQVSDLPPGGQGRTYAIQSVRRNEDGTVDYALVLRTAKTTHTPEHVQSSNEFETVYVESWDNVYGEPDDFQDHNGDVVAIPNELDVKYAHRPSLVTRHVTRNADCTYKVDISRKSPVEAVSAETSSQKTVYATDDSSEVLAQAQALPEAPVASNGRVVTHKTKKRADGFFDNTEVVHQELTVYNAIVESKKTLRGRVNSVTHKGCVFSGSSPAKIGQSVRSEKTDGGLWNVTHVNQVAKPLSQVRTRCHRTTFVHSHDETNIETSSPSADVSKASGGVVRTRTIEANDFGGYEVTDTKTTELNVPKAVVDERIVSKGVITRTTNRGQTESLSPKPGCPQVTNEKTDGGLVNVTSVTLEARSGPDRAVVECDAFSSTTESTVIDIGNAVTVPAASGGSGGRVVRTVVEADDNGFVTQATRTQVERAYEGSTKETRVTNRAIIESVSSRNMVRASSKPDEPGTSRSSEVTPGGRYNLKSVKVTPRIGALERSVKYTSALKRVTETSRVGFVPEEPDGGLSGIVQRTTSVDENGVPVVTLQQTYDRAVQVSHSEHVGNFTSETTDVQVTPERPDKPEPSPRVSQTVSYELLESGMYRVTTKTRTVRSFNWSPPDMDSGYSFAMTRYFRYYTQEEAFNYIQELSHDYTGHLTSWINDNRGPHSNAIDVSVDFDAEYGTISGVVKISASWLPEQAGTKGVTDKVFVQFQYKTTSVVGSYIAKAKGTTCYYLHKYWQHIEGRGLQKFEKLLRSPLYDASFSFNPRTLVWSVDMCTNIIVNTSSM